MATATTVEGFPVPLSDNTGWRLDGPQSMQARGLSREHLGRGDVQGRAGRPGRYLWRRSAGYCSRGNAR